MRRIVLALLAPVMAAACGLSVVGIDEPNEPNVDAGAPDSSAIPPVTDVFVPAAVIEDAGAADATLTMHGSAQTTAIDFTSEGTSDWVYWGETPPDRKADGGKQIADYVINPVVAATYSGPGTAMSWTDGTLVRSMTSATNVALWATNATLTFSVPALPTQQTFVLYVGGLNSNADFEAKLGDALDVKASASTYVDTTPQYTLRLAVDFSSPAPANLTLTWKLTSCNVACGTSAYFALNGGTLAVH